MMGGMSPMGGAPASMDGLPSMSDDIPGGGTLLNMAYRSEPQEEGTGVSQLIETRRKGAYRIIDPRTGKDIHAKRFRIVDPKTGREVTPRDLEPVPAG